MNLPLEILYRAYSDWTKDEMDKIKDNVKRSPWRASYHIEPKTGLLNDPNGFSFLTENIRFFIKIGHLELLMG